MQLIIFIKFKQIVIEFHGIYDNTWIALLEDKIECFEKLTITHYLIHIHGNNNSECNSSGLPSVIEATYIRKDIYIGDNIPQINHSELPCKLDTPNISSKSDYSLNFSPFVNL